MGLVLSSPLLALWQIPRFFPPSLPLFPPPTGEMHKQCQQGRSKGPLVYTPLGRRGPRAHPAPNLSPNRPQIGPNPRLDTISRQMWLAKVFNSRHQAQWAPPLPQKAFRSRSADTACSPIVKSGENLMPMPLILDSKKFSRAGSPSRVPGNHALEEVLALFHLCDWLLPHSTAANRRLRPKLLRNGLPHTAQVKANRLNK